MSEFTIKDSGERAQFDSGMQRDTTTGKVRYDLALDGPMFQRYAEHMTKGAVKYDARNWMKANSPEEMERFHQSAIRHFMQWALGDLSEDHAAAVVFNLNGYEYVRGLLATQGREDVKVTREELLAKLRAEGVGVDAMQRQANANLKKFLDSDGVTK